MAAVEMKMAAVATVPEKGTYRLNISGRWRTRKERGGRLPVKHWEGTVRKAFCISQRVHIYDIALYFLHAIFAISRKITISA